MDRSDTHRAQYRSVGDDQWFPVSYIYKTKDL